MKKRNTVDDWSLVRRIIDAGGTLHREGARWRIGQTNGQALLKAAGAYSDNAIVMGHAEAVRVDNEFKVKMAERRAQFEKKFGANE